MGELHLLSLAGGTLNIRLRSLLGGQWVLRNSEGCHEAVPTRARVTSGGIIPMPMRQLGLRRQGFGTWPGSLTPCPVHPRFVLWCRRPWEIRNRSSRPFRVEPQGGI